MKKTWTSHVNIIGKEWVIWLKVSTDFPPLSLVKRLFKKRNFYRKWKSQNIKLFRSPHVILAPAHLPASPSPMGSLCSGIACNGLPVAFFPITRAKIIWCSWIQVVWLPSIPNHYQNKSWKLTVILYINNWFMDTSSIHHIEPRTYNSFSPPLSFRDLLPCERIKLDV